MSRISSGLLPSAVAAPTSAIIAITYTTNDPTVTTNGAITIADGAAITVVETVEFLEELNDQVSLLAAEAAVARVAINAIIDSNGN